MRIMRACVLLCLAATTLAVDEHRPKKRDDRGKRNLEYQLSHHYSNLPSYRLERRISTGPQYQIPPQYFPRPYRKGRPHSYPVPYYAVQMEPLVHYSQRDPLYDTNIFSLDSHNDDLLTENNQIQDNVDRYGYHKPHVVERPVYIKEPEPIIEIIIKESNVSLPAPPSPPPPPKKKKEQVQVFYVKYQKNPHGSGKDAIIYDKPVPAIAPKIPEHEEEHEEEAPYNYQPESATAPPPPSTTLRTIIRPDSETYHSPSGVKVTFGKEGFDYDKRSSKPEDYQPHQSSQVPQGRQLTSFSNTYFKRPATNQNYQTIPPGFRSDVRPPQPYRPVSFPSPTNYKPFGRPTAPQYQQQQSKYSFQAPPHPKQNQQFNSFSPQSPHFSHTISHPPPPRFQSPRPTAPQVRQPVPYKPFENFRPQQTFSQTSPDGPPQIQQQIQFRPETHFPVHQQLPLTEQTNTFNQHRFNQPTGQYNSGELPQKPGPHHSTHSSQTHAVQQLPNAQPPQNFLQHHHIQQQNEAQQNVQHQLHQANLQQQHSQNQQSPLRNYNEQQHFIPQSEHGHNLQTAQNILPPGGELIQSVPKFEQHISSVEPATHDHNQNLQYQQNSATREQPRKLPPQHYQQHESVSNEQSQGLSPQQYQQKIIQQFNLNGNSQEQTSRAVSYSHQQNSHRQEEQEASFHQQQNHQRQEEQEQLRHFYQLNPDIKQENIGFAASTPRSNEYQATRKTSEIVNSTPRISYQSTTSKPSSTATQEPETPSTTTKDPKVLEAQLPDEVPEELRQQLLSSGILNNADISILDYDKVGDIPLSALPPDQLANFYGAGGAAQISAGSDPVPSVVQRDGTRVEDRLVSDDDELEPAASDFREVTALPLGPPSAVDLKVVHYDPDTDKGQQVQQKYVADQAAQVNPVVLNDNTYNRYLPLKVNGTQFPIPDAPELKGKKISSVVVLAPVTYDFSPERKTRQTTRELSNKSSDIKLIQGEALKDLLANPTLENYQKFLDSENNTKADKQSVILLVTDSSDGSNQDKEIFMYDVVSRSVTKLSGELSSAFVEAAEANSNDKSEETAASNIVETRVSYNGEIDRESQIDEDLEDAASDIKESKIPLIDPLQEEDMDTEASDNLERFVDISGKPVEDFAVSNSLEHGVSIPSGYIKTGHL